ncbi:hypothetical protein KJ840_03400 [Patescibacteria group bacterium]|nr:hypothetical protein [Patescibacteria group bacterium]
MIREIFCSSEAEKSEPVIKILKGSEALEESKKNPFYDEYHWGLADWEDGKLYLPESDQAISWVIAVHEIGHLVKEGRFDLSESDFDSVKAEEKRAWQQGWGYLKKYISEYYPNEPEVLVAIEEVKKVIEDEMIAIVELSKPFYEGALEDITVSRVNFAETELGKQIKQRIDGFKRLVRNKTAEINQLQLNEQVDWDKYIGVVKKALLDIERDNEIFESQKDNN